MIEFALPLCVTGVDLDPKESRLPKKDAISVSNILATFAYIRGRKMRLRLFGSLDHGISGKGRITSEGHNW